MIQKHEFKTAREYKQHIGVDVRKGIVPQWYHDLKAYQAIENGTVENTLKYGVKTRFKKGQVGVGVYQRSEETMRRLKHKK